MGRDREREGVKGEGGGERGRRERTRNMKHTYCSSRWLVLRFNDVRLLKETLFPLEMCSITLWILIDKKLLYGWLRFNAIWSVLVLLNLL